MTAGTFTWLVAQEAKRLLLARWVAGGAVLLCACSVFSVVLSIRDLQEHTEAHRELVQQRLEAQVRNLTGRVLGRAAEPGLRAIRPPAPGGVLTLGIERALPAAWEFTPAGTEALDPYVRSDTSANDRSIGDLAGIIAGLGGLLALWLGVSIVVSDRAAGRIAALRTLPVAPGRIALLQLVSGTVALAVATALWTVTTLVTIRTLVPADVAIPVLMPVRMAGPVLCYLALLYAIGTAVGSIAREELSALVTTFLIWMAIVFVVPQTNQLITGAVSDVPPRNRMEVERRERIADEVRSLEGEIGSAMGPLWPSGPFPNDKQQSIAYFAVGEPLWREGAIRIRDIADLEERQWREQDARAERLKRRLDSLNPSWWLLQSMAELAGTGRSTEIQWAEAIAGHQKLLNQQLFDNRPKVNARVFWQGNGIPMAFDRHQAPRYSDLPLFVAPPDHSGAWTSAARRSFAGLAAYTMLAMAAAYFSLRSRLR